MPGSHLWDNQVLWPTAALPSSYTAPAPHTRFISLNLCLHHITPVFKNCDGVCLTVYWFVSKYFNVVFLALHNLFASHKFYFLAGWLPVSPVKQSYFHRQRFTKCFSPFLLLVSLPYYFKSYPSFKAPTPILHAAVPNYSIPHRGSFCRQ